MCNRGNGVNKIWLNDMQVMAAAIEFGYNFRKDNKGSCFNKIETPISESSYDDFNWEKAYPQFKKMGYKQCEVCGLWCKIEYIKVESFTEDEMNNLFELLSKELDTELKYDNHKITDNHIDIISKDIDLKEVGLFGKSLKSMNLYLYNHNDRIDKDQPLSWFSTNWGYKFKSLGSNGHEVWSDRGRLHIQFDIINRTWLIKAMPEKQDTLNIE